jgi:hypothetical protein
MCGLKEPGVGMKHKMGFLGAIPSVLGTAVRNYGDIFWQLRPERPTENRPGRKKL